MTDGRATNSRARSRTRDISDVILQIFGIEPDIQYRQAIRDDRALQQSRVLAQKFREFRIRPLPLRSSGDNFRQVVLRRLTR